MLDPNTTALLSQLGIDAATAESWLPGLMALTVLALVAVFPTVMIAQRKGRSKTLWLLLALSIPLLPLLLVWLLPARPEPPAQKERA